MYYDKEKDYLLLKEVELDFRKVTPIDFIKTFRPEFKFEKTEKGLFPLKFLLWGKNDEPMLGYIDGVICGTWFNHGEGKLVEGKGHPDFPDRYFISEKTQLGDLLIISYSPQKPSLILLHNQAGIALLYTAYLHEKTLVVEANLQDQSS